MIAIINYKTGNYGSILNMVKKVGGEAMITSDKDEISRAEKLILPGVGAFDHGMRNLRELGLVPLLDEMVLQRKVPILGICLGMQLLTRGSEEQGGSERERGLGWIAADTVRFQPEAKANKPWKLPHMGWNHVAVQGTHPLFYEMHDDPRFYFVHTYHVQCDEPQSVLCRSEYAYEFTSAVVRDNILGTQFHPEKSHKFGIRLMHNFVNAI